MVIQSDKVVNIHYVLKDIDGALIDSTEGMEPLEYIQGKGFLLPKIESALEGKSSGDKVSVLVEPKDGYGEWDASLVMDIPRSNFATDAEIKEGMQFHAGDLAGSRIVTVKKVGPDSVTVDANHQLAGKKLQFEIEVVSVRDATEEELNFSCGGGCGGCGGGCGGSCGDGGCGCGDGGEGSCGGCGCSCG